MTNDNIHKWGMGMKLATALETGKIKRRGTGIMTTTASKVMTAIDSGSVDYTEAILYILSTTSDIYHSDDGRKAVYLFEDGSSLTDRDGIIS